MLHEVLVIIGMEVILLVSLAAMTFHRRRTDVLSGRYFSNDQSDDVMPDLDIEQLERGQIARQKSAPAPLDKRPRPPLSPRSEPTSGRRWGLWRSSIRDVTAAELSAPLARAWGWRRARSMSKADVSTSAPGQDSQARATLPEGTRIYAVGDVHGRSDLLERVLAAIDADCKQRPIARPISVFVGDYIDRGPGSRNVLDLLLQWQRGARETIFLRGNHETFLPRFLADPRSLDEWRQYGGLETLLSYGLKPSINPDRDEQTILATEFAEILPQEHLDFLQSLELTFNCGDFLFVHAGVRPGVPIHEQTEDDLLWIRDDFLNWEQPFERLVVHGHTPVSQPDLRPNRINIDTGAYATGRLTCVIIENTAVTRLSDEGQLGGAFSAPLARAALDPARA